MLKLVLCVISTLLSASGLPPDEQHELVPGTLPTAQPLYAANLERAPKLAKALWPAVSCRVQQLATTQRRLRECYQAIQHSWESSLAKRERERDGMRLRRVARCAFAAAWSVALWRRAASTPSNSARTKPDAL